MSYMPIERVEIENYGCIKNLSVTLSPLHALIGPNDSGKSTILRAIRTAAQLAVSDFRAKTDSTDDYEPFDPRVGLNPQGSTIILKSYDVLGYGIRTIKNYEFTESIYVENDTDLQSEKLRPLKSVEMRSSRGTDAFSESHPAVQMMKNRLTPATMIRFDPDFLRAPAPLIPDEHGIAFADERGTGLASVFDAIINRDTEAFAKIQDEVRTLFPSVAKVGLINTSDSKKEIAVTLVDGTRVGAKSISEGLLYYLGFTALRYVDGSKLFLVEEPENGLHPSRIAEVMRSLREISKTGQVIIATHSPLVINELEGNEVSVITRDKEQGTRAILLKEVPHFEESIKVYRPGEFWVSYCDGDQETPLLTGTPRT